MSVNNIESFSIVRLGRFRVPRVLATGINKKYRVFTKSERCLAEISNILLLGRTPSKGSFTNGNT